MNSSLAGRIAVAAALLIGFYVLASGVAVGLLAIAVLQWVTDLPQNIWVTAACVLTGLAILRGIVPRRVGFEPPGPRLDEADAAELHALVREIADATGQERPEAIYLAADLNAAVTEVGGVLGIGGRRVLIVGLPLLAVLNVGRLRAVLAHEFGHYHGGDTKLGPWFFRAHDAIARTIEALEQRESIFRRPFLWYGHFFLRRSAAIKRRQEFVADELAAEVAGKREAIETLRCITAAAPAFDDYWVSEVSPVLEGGFRVGIVEGFDRFRSASPVREAMEHAVEHELSEPDSDPYRSHPSLQERVAALERLPDGERARGMDERPALMLLSDLDRLEYELLVALASEEAARSLRALPWDDVPERVMAASWRNGVAAHNEVLAGLTVGGLAEAASQLDELGRAAVGSDNGAAQLAPEAAEDIGGSLLAMAMSRALHDAGLRIDAPLGEPVALERDGLRFEPGEDIRALAGGNIDAAAWRQRCERARVGDLTLALNDQEMRDAREEGTLAAA